MHIAESEKDARAEGCRARSYLWISLLGAPLAAAGSVARRLGPAHMQGNSAAAVDLPMLQRDRSRTEAEVGRGRRRLVRWGLLGGTKVVLRPAVGAAHALIRTKGERRGALGAADGHRPHAGP